MPAKLVPGTVMRFNDSIPMFETLQPIIDLTDGLTLSQVCSITGLEASTIQNWVKRGFVARPVKKKYHERQLARILLISAIRDSMKIESIGELMGMINGNADDESDDIISEQELYGYFCEAVGQAKNIAAKIEEIPSLVEKVTESYEGESENDRQRLREALDIMVYAYTAAQYKRIADNKLTKMKEVSSV